MTTDTDHFTLSRHLPLPPDRLWQVLTDARAREHWGAPTEGMVLSVEVTDLREGGLERHRCGPAEAPDFIVDTRWYRLDPPSLAVFTETLRFEGMTVGTSLVTYALTPQDGGTALDLAVSLSSFSGPEATADFRLGWEGGLANLDRYVAALATGAPA
ncbi:SRPBCC domain-containing protein [Histidinibacterium lentulum]|uniref:Activator of Hsp90 ATPase homologue 1/2-like C-terminal domain-containing protein n=1 Tax=Histidinibacterium lentulum TaxID=2480588 RepID=A0A3N2R544_9RHOB|nr:SRPBCC domain-containing protein [Histidinibacterium lentulum]ROU02466.1 hypothetical protein EAT49_08990 [Histidinibacterium lentulum]